MVIKVFGCPSLQKELYLLAALSPNDIDVETIPHAMSRDALQKKIDSAVADRILLVFGQRRLEGLHSTSVPVIAPRAHDCAHLLLGSAERYRRAFSENDDSPRWLNNGGCGYAESHGSPCVVRSPLPFAVPLPAADAREYAADLSLLKALVNMTFEPSQAIVVAPGFGITADPVEIISCEPV